MGSWGAEITLVGGDGGGDGNYCHFTNNRLGLSGLSVIHWTVVFSVQCDCYSFET